MAQFTFSCVRRARGNVYRRFSGKGPTRQPVNSGLKAQSRTMKAKAQKRTFKANVHHMTTRQKAKAFRVLDLPAELRAAIFEFAVRDDELDEEENLEDISIPSLMQVCRQMRMEVGPIYFAKNRFTATVISNWCEVNDHFHENRRSESRAMGALLLPSLLPGSDGPSAMIHGPTIPSDMIRFRGVKLLIECACHVDNEIGSLTLRINGRRPTAELTVISEMPTTNATLTTMKGKVDNAILGTSERQVFNGFTIEDLKDVARCFIGKA